jgi:ribosomal protein L16/L10AE
VQVKKHQRIKENMGNTSKKIREKLELSEIMHLMDIELEQIRELLLHSVSRRNRAIHRFYPEFHLRKIRSKLTYLANLSDHFKTASISYTKEVQKIRRKSNE